MGVFERLEALDPEPLTAANPTGKNGYDSGMTFEESTKGVERDSGGKFAPESGSHRGRFRGNYSNAKGRAARRRASMARSKKAREEKETKKTDSEANKMKREAAKQEREREKTKREAERRKREAQQAVLSQISLQISEAILAGDTIRAAELRVERAKKVLEFADTPVGKTNAQITLNNATKSLVNAREAEQRKREKAKRAGIRSRNLREEQSVRDSYDRTIERIPREG